MILRLEDTILPGGQYWVKQLAKDEKLDYLNNIEAEKPKKISEVAAKVIDKIMMRKTQKIDLAEDLAQIGKRLSKLNLYLQSLNGENRKMPNILEILQK